MKAELPRDMGEVTKDMDNHSNTFDGSARVRQEQRTRLCYPADCHGLSEGTAQGDNTGVEGNQQSSDAANAEGGGSPIATHSLNKVSGRNGPSSSTVDEAAAQLARLEALLDKLSHLIGITQQPTAPLAPRQASVSDTSNSDITLPAPQPTSTLQETTTSEVSHPTAEQNESLPLSTLLSNAITKTTALFAIDPPRSPRAESQMSYSLSVNSKYRAHMDDAPKRAEELEAALRTAQGELSKAKDLVDECHVVASVLRDERDRVQGPEVVMAGGHGGGEKRDGHAQAEESPGEPMTLEERMRKAEIKSERFI